MAGWHHWLDGHESEWTPGCCDSWGRKESDTTEPLNWTELNWCNHMGFSGCSDGKESVCNAGELGSIPGLGRSPGEGNGYSLQYSGLKNSVDSIVHTVAKSWTWLSNFTFTSFSCNHTDMKLRELPESSSSSQGISLKGWVVSVGNDVGSDSRYRTTCLFRASGPLLYLFKSIRLEVWHFQFPLTQIIVSLLPFKQSSCFSDSLRILFTCDYIVTHAYVWAAYYIPQFISYLSKSCLPLVS